jgi:hypothetical protein
MLHQTQANRQERIDAFLPDLERNRDMFIDSYEQDQKAARAEVKEVLFRTVSRCFEKALRLFLSKHKSQLHVMTNVDEELEARKSSDLPVLNICVRHETTADQWNLSFVLGEDRKGQPEIRLNYVLEKLNGKGEYERRRTGQSIVMGVAQFLKLGEEIFLRDHFVEIGAQVDPRSIMLHTFNENPPRAAKPQAPKRRTVEQRQFLELLRQEHLKEIAGRMNLA